MRANRSAGKLRIEHKERASGLFAMTATRTAQNTSPQPRARARSPERMCALTRERGADSDLLRFVYDPQGRVIADIYRDLPGRGVWLTPTRAAVLEAVRKKVFARAFKAQVAASAELADEIDRLLLASALQSLSMARKAGKVVSGYAKIEAMLNEGAVGVLLHAVEAAADGSGKLDRKYRAASASRGENTTILRVFTSSQLSMALGRENVIHAALEKSAVTETFLRNVRRWLLYNGADGVLSAIGTPASSPTDQDLE